MNSSPGCPFCWLTSHVFFRHVGILVWTLKRSEFSLSLLSWFLLILLLSSTGLPRAPDLSITAVLCELWGQWVEGSCLAWMKSSVASPTLLRQLSHRSPSGSAVKHSTAQPPSHSMPTADRAPGRSVMCHAGCWCTHGPLRIATRPLSLASLLEEPSHLTLTECFCSVSCPCTF